MFFIDANSKGISRRLLDSTSDEQIAYVIFDNVEIPKENIIGELNNGFMQVMYNFNPERLGIVIQTIAYARKAYEESLKYVLKRKIYNK